MIYLKKWKLHCSFKSVICSECLHIFSRLFRGTCRFCLKICLDLLKKTEMISKQSKFLFIHNNRDCYLFVSSFRKVLFHDRRGKQSHSSRIAREDCWGQFEQFFYCSASCLIFQLSVFLLWSAHSFFWFSSLASLLKKGPFQKTDEKTSKVERYPKGASVTFPSQFVRLWSIRIFNNQYKCIKMSPITTALYMTMTGVEPNFCLNRITGLRIWMD